MINVILNAYAVNPDWGSEQGMGWNWVINIARHCHVDVITEGEFRENIERALLALPQRENIEFHYLPVSDEVRKMCWNQGDWRFYKYYRQWQKRALACAQEIIGQKQIDIVHQLNMIGFREPGYLWEIKDIPFVWGPVGGMELMPMAYLKGAPLKQRIFNRVKNTLNRLQYTHSGRVKSAIERASVIIAAVKGVKDVIGRIHGKGSILINETGVEIDPSVVKSPSRAGEPLKLIWVGKFDFRKQLPLALKSVAATGRRDIELHICGDGSERVKQELRQLADELKIADLCHWHGNVENREVKRMMAVSDLMFFTSIMEATSTVVLEAISVGLPVVCFNTCGFGPIVNDFAGFTVEISNPEQSVADFADKLNYLNDHRDAINSVSQRIIEERDSLTWESKARRTAELYKNILAGK